MSSDGERMVTGGTGFFFGLIISLVLVEENIYSARPRSLYGEPFIQFIRSPDL